MAIVSSCNSGNIFYNDPDALQITNRFCACPAARTLLASFGDRISIDVRTGSYSGISVRFVATKNALRSGDNAEIRIPQQTLKTINFALFGLAHEVFNVKQRNEVDALGDRALAGDVDMDEYAKNIETTEFKSSKGAIDLSLKCKFLSQSDLKDITEGFDELDLETNLWEKEFVGHTDNIRKQWIKFYQKAYCQKNPGEKSCKIKPQDLSDYYQMLKMSREEQVLFKYKRICERLSDLPQKTIDLYFSEPSEVEICHSLNKEEL